MDSVGVEGVALLCVRRHVRRSDQLAWVSFCEVLYVAVGSCALHLPNSLVVGDGGGGVRPSMSHG